jgi:hypothetical protein
MIFETEKPEGGVLCEVVSEKDNQEVIYACITAPGIVRCEVFLDNVLIDVVFAGVGGSHSWWAGASAPLVKPMQKGQKLKVVVSGPSAFRVDMA